MVLVAAPAAAASPAAVAPPPAIPVLAVCADPSNLPYSNDRQEGFENRIARLLATDLHADLRYTWYREHSSFFRRTLLAGVCDVVISVPASLPNVAVTRPYFTSSYVAVTRARDGRHFVTFDDPWLRDARIGVQQVGAEGYTTPPAMSLTARGIDEHLVFYPMWAADDVSNPQGKIIDAVADGSIDVALVWGPFAGYFAKAHPGALRIEPITGDTKRPDAKFAFPMAAAVRKADTGLRDVLQAAIDRHQTEIAAIVADYAIPTAPVRAMSAAAVADKADLPPPTHKSGG
jgi:quinoprotein dehydrogenase-associated probable ABC transporter substrate-binding protein